MDGMDDMDEMDTMDEMDGRQKAKDQSNGKDGGNGRDGKDEKLMSEERGGVDFEGLARRMAVNSGLRVSEMKRALGGILGVVVDAVVDGESVSFQGLGRFSRRELRGDGWDPKRKMKVARRKRRVWFKGADLAKVGKGAAAVPAGQAGQVVKAAKAGQVTKAGKAGQVTTAGKAGGKAGKVVTAAKAGRAKK